MPRGAKSRHKGNTPFKRGKIQTKLFPVGSLGATSSRHNRYSSLSSMEDLDEISESNIAPEVKTYKPPPIVTDINIPLKEIQHILGSDCIYKRTSIGTKIFPQTTEKYNFCVNALKENKIEFHSFNSKENRLYTTFLYGLPKLNISDIQAELVNSNLDPKCITEVTTKFSSENDAVYKVQFLRKTFNPKSLHNIKTICNVVINWKKNNPKKNNKPTQCWNCLMYGHGGEHCSRKSVCMTCAKDHSTNVCPFTKNNKKPAVFACFNCKKHGYEKTDHAANDINCPLRALYLEIRSKVTSRNQKRVKVSQQRTHYNTVPTGNHTSSNTFHQSGFSQNNIRSYARVTRDHNQDLFSIDQLFDIFTSSLEELSRCTTKVQQISVVMSLLKYAHDIK